MLLTEERVLELIKLAENHARKNNLIPEIYVSALINADTIGDHDAGMIVENLIKDHENRL